MSATNHTSNYQLPVFVGTDVPSWLVDWNNTMTAIDTALGNNRTSIDKNTTDVQLLNTEYAEVESSLTNLQEQVTTNTANITTAQGNISTLTTTVGSLSSTVEQVQGEVGTYYSGTLSIGETTLTISVPTLTNDSIIDVYTDAYGTDPTDISSNLVDKTIIMTFPIMSATVRVRIKVVNL